MAFDEATSDYFNLIKHEVVELRPGWQALEIVDSQQAIFFMIASVALKGSSHTIGMPADDGAMEMITVEPMGAWEDERFSIAISSDRENSQLKYKFATIVDTLFKLLNAEDKASSVD